MSVLLAPARRPARDLVVATRLPPFPKEYTGNPFTSLGDVVADCEVEGCGYHVQGERSHVKLALKEHHRLFHPESISVVRLNLARQ